MSPSGVADFTDFFLKPAHKSRVTQQSLTANFQTAGACFTGPAHEAQDEPYDATDDFSRSIDACYAVIRDRVAAGGEGWKPK
jgi:hypothetical protein